MAQKLLIFNSVALKKGSLVQGIFPSYKNDTVETITQFLNMLTKGSCIPVVYCGTARAPGNLRFTLPKYGLRHERTE